ncbi:MAG: hypothetical protein VX170_03330, partial [Pseudomonadota bacterium]|nr:hypothetical protein [Pseudomonadota bacterium]
SFSADAAAGAAVSTNGLNSDLHASAEYRAHLVGVMASRAVAACYGETHRQKQGGPLGPPFFLTFHERHQIKKSLTNLTPG